MIEDKAKKIVKDLQELDDQEFLKVLEKVIELRGIEDVWLRY